MYDIYHRQSLSQRGFTVVEIFIVVFILVIIVTLSSSAFLRFNKRQELNATVADVRSVLEEARALTLASKNNLTYGVHFESDEITRFSGSTYAPSSPDNKMTKIPSRIIATTSLTGGGQDVLFEKLTGKTNNSGTVVLLFASDPSASTTITIYATGIVE